MAVRGVMVLLALVSSWISPSWGATPPPESPAARSEAAHLARLPALAPAGRIDHSGRKQRGRASFYARHFANRRMADGNRFNPNANVAASRSLPLGTTAKLTNERNGRSATVRIEDRGPHLRSRVVDVSPHVAAQLGIGHEGVAPVVLSPIAVPQPDGQVKLGAGAAEVSQEELRRATRETLAASK